MAPDARRHTAETGGEERSHGDDHGPDDVRVTGRRVTTSGRGTMSGARGTATSVLSTVLSAFPVFVLGSLAPLLGPDIGLAEASIGGVVATYFVASALCSVPGGRLSERLGWSRVVVAGGLATGAVAAIGAASVRTPLHLVVLAGVLGVANGLTQPAATEVLSSAVPSRRQGPAFGAKHAAVPTASLLAGLSIPTLALTVGWRWTFAAVAVLAVPLTALVPWGAGVPRPRRHATASLRHDVDGWLVLTATGSGLATASANAVAAYLVVAAAAEGIALGTAGLLLSACSIACIITRVASGFVPTPGTGHLPLVLALVGGGTAGHVLLATSSGSPVRFAAGALLAFAGGWGWAAVLGLGVVRAYPRATATATGVLHVGTFTGGVVGPAVFGLVVGAASYPIAWAVTAGLSTASLACFAVVWRAPRRAASGRSQHHGPRRDQSDGDPPLA